MSKPATPKKRGKSPLSPREIVLSAFKSLSEIVDPNGGKIDKVRVEELEPIDEGEFWNVVLSYDLMGEFPFDRTREYKQFKIDGKEGKIIWMKIKKV